MIDFLSVPPVNAAKNEKSAVFRTESKTKKAVHLMMVSASGLVHNAHAGIILNEITGDDLFESC